MSVGLAIRAGGAVPVGVGGERTSAGERAEPVLVAVVAASAGVDARSLGMFELRNLPDPVELFDLDPCPTPHDREIDPVCRMAIDRSVAAGRLDHHGHEHWFCSLTCAGAFASDPDRYTHTDANG